MDIFTHAVLPLALFALLRRPVGERLAAGLGAAMPDMDFFFAWVTTLDDSLYAFTHRGWSHSLWGAPLLAGLGLGILALPFWAKRWPRMAAFRFSPWTLGAAVVGALAHVALDALTISGVPALWPLSVQRQTLNLFFFSMVYLTPVSAYLVWRLYRGTLSEALLYKGAALLVAAIVVGGGLRAATYPKDVPDGAVVQPTPSELRWIVATPVQGGWDVEDRIAAFGQPARHVILGNATPAAADAVAAAQRLGAYVGWSWGNPAPVVNASLIDGGWRVEFRDAIALHRNATGGVLAGVLREPKPLVVDVVEGRARVVDRPGTFGLGG